jgi:AraC-like DNA-binding protein
MVFHRYSPQGLLSEFVDVLWYCEGYALSRAEECLLPTGTVELVIDLSSGRPSDSVVAGIWSRPAVIERTAQDRILGVHFKPGGVFPFLRFPCGELHNCDITLGDFWGEQHASQLLCLLHDATTVEAQCRILERWLLQSATRPLQHHFAVSLAMAEFRRIPHPVATAGIVEQVNISHRRFIQIFRDEVGVAPKMFHRIQRFQRAVSGIYRDDDVDWLDVALSCGYYDQAHFIHDFQEFSEFTPTTYLSLRTEHPNHVRRR